MHSAEASGARASASWRGAFVRGVQAFVDELYPAVCPVCRAPAPARARSGTHATGTCAEHALPDPDAPPEEARCGVCARALPPMLPDGTRCATCRRDRPRYHRLVTLGDYRRDTGLREWILALKHGRRRDLAEPLGRAMAQRLRSVRSGPVLLVPVPLHPLRRLERGFDQAALLARAIAAFDSPDGAPRRSAGSTACSLLERTRWTSPQGAIGAVSRTANVARAFTARSVAFDLRGVSVWLVDDVVTSGATVDACAAALGTLGAGRVSVLCAARAGARAADMAFAP